MSEQERRFHSKWLGMVQPAEGLVVSLPVLEDANCYRRQGSAVYRQFRDLCVEVPPPQGASHKHATGSLRAIADLRTFLAKMLNLDAELLDEGDALPAALQVNLAEGQEILRPTLAFGDKPRLRKGKRASRAKQRKQVSTT